MKNDISSWSEFKIQDLFNIKYGVNLEFNKCDQTTKDDPNGVAFVSRTSLNNGISGYVKRIDNISPQQPGTITVVGGGSVLETFLQYREYYSGRDLYVLTPKIDMTFESKIYNNSYQSK